MKVSRLGPIARVAEAPQKSVGPGSSSVAGPFSLVAFLWAVFPQKLFRNIIICTYVVVKRWASSSTAILHTTVPVWLLHKGKWFWRYVFKQGKRVRKGWILWFQHCENRFVLLTLRSGYSEALRPEEGQSTRTKKTARQTCFPNAGIREPNLLSWLRQRRSPRFIRDCRDDRCRWKVFIG